MALRDTTWFMDTSDTGSETVPLDSNAVIIEYNKKAAETLILADGSSLTRSRTMITSEWMCMTYLAAKRAVDTEQANPIANSEFQAVLTNQVGNAWKIVRHVDSIGSWN